ncbi:uncharacterized protein LOC21406770 [Morus notabilis]|uniref:uncharacterized protein LOC21406770 n=1 Tax=Morus notabilis TaxID=981085 RepID=UPI000CED0DB5|nr:uncharacterized protein LOC21406770 [Morus notabilis]
MPRANVRVPRRYGVEVTDVILPGKARTTFNKRVLVPETDTEPPELGNWFPSYKYESPVLDSDDNFEESVFEEKVVRKEKILIDDCERGKEESLREFGEKGEKDEVLVGDDKGGNQSSSEDIYSYCSPSLSSEPIDVKNWFPSYVYESPALDTNDGFKDSLNKESECEEDRFIVDESNREKAEGYVKLKRTTKRDGVESSNGLANCGNYCGNNQLEKQLLNKNGRGSGEVKHILSDKSNMCFGSTLEQCSSNETMRNPVLNPAKEVELSSLDQENPQCVHSFSREIGIRPLHMQGRTCSNDRELSQKLMCRMENIKDSEAKGRQVAGHLSSKNDRKSDLVNEATRESTHGFKDKENDGKEISKDGFVTTRKGRYSKANAENLQKIPKETGRQTVSQSGGEDSVVERKALSERTNFDLSGVTEIVGKWQCPQKRKPNLGPPLKQLRLERWVQRK